MAGGGLVGHVPAAVGCVVLDMDESDDDGSAFMDRHPPFWDSPSRRAGGLHLYYLSRVQYGNKKWRWAAPAGRSAAATASSSSGTPMTWPTCWPTGRCFDNSPEDQPFPAVALGARTQLPQDWGLRTPPPRREPAEQRSVRRQSLASGHRWTAETASPGVFGSRPTGGVGAEGTAWAFAGCTGTQRRHGSPRGPQLRTLRRRPFLRLHLTPGTWGTNDVRAVGQLHPGIRSLLQCTCLPCP